MGQMTRSAARFRALGRQHACHERHGNRPGRHTARDTGGGGVETDRGGPVGETARNGAAQLGDADCDLPFGHCPFRGESGQCCACHAVMVTKQPRCRRPARGQRVLRVAFAPLARALCAPSTRRTSSSRPSTTVAGLPLVPFLVTIFLQLCIAPRSSPRQASLLTLAL